MGLQKALNYFSIKDTKGRPFKVDGVIGDETSAALKNIGYKDIYEWRETITNYQKMHNVPPRPDGIVGDNTLKAFQASNLTNINQLSRYKPGNQQANVAQVSNNSANAISNNLNGANKVTMSESELKQIIHESIDSVLNETYTVNLQKMGTPGPSAPAFNYQSEVENFLKNAGYSQQQIRNGFANGAVTVSNTSNNARKQRNFAKSVYSKADYAKNGYKNTQGAATYQINQFIEQTGLEGISPGITNLINNRYGNVSNWKSMDFNGWKQWFTLKGKEFLNGKAYKQVVDYLYNKTEQQPQE